MKDGEERGFTAAEFKSAQAEGWEKQYQYKVDKKKVYMVPSQAEKHGYERASKYPKSTKYGRQNPISAHWNSEEQLLAWREDGRQRRTAAWSWPVTTAASTTAAMRRGGWRNGPRFMRAWRPRRWSGAASSRPL